ncbi:hypothetical protein HEP87_11130 [Streptomyces sp. S1D4-11]|nr:hypothetical protein [Streptomyces sp. S1D4-11]QIY94465.1 hypothetical protein HEP87_11130 [Streptomyces sp. S1D4-11]
MPGIGLHADRARVHAILAHSQIVLDNSGDAEWPGLEALLVTAAENSSVLDTAGTLSPERAALLAAESAWHVVNAAGQIASGLTDPRLTDLLARLDSLPPETKVDLLSTAAQRTRLEPPPGPSVAPAQVGPRGHQAGHGRRPGT